MVEIWAEPGGCAEGRHDLMIRLIDAAADAWATTFKAQWVSDPAQLCAHRQAPEYLADYTKLAYPLAWHAEFRAHARQRGLGYACSIYLPHDAATIAPFVDAIKVSSFEAPLRDVLDAAVATRLAVVASLGMGGHAGDGYPQVRWLACTSAYPAPLDDLGLRRIGCEGYHGYSDHSHDVRVGAWAVCAGATLIEAHLRLDDTDPANKDYATAFTPAEFAAYVQQIREAERALGDGQQRLMPSEAPMLRYRVGGAMTLKREECMLTMSVPTDCWVVDELVSKEYLDELIRRMRAAGKPNDSIIGYRVANELYPKTEWLADCEKRSVRVGGS